MDPAGPFRYEHFAMNTRFEILAYGPDEDIVGRVARIAFADVDRLEDSFSYFLEDSELGHVNREAARGEVAIGVDLAAILEAARILCESTGGVFDPTVGPLMKCWSFHDGMGRMPSPEALDDARRRVGFRHVRLDAARRTVHFALPGVELDLGAIGKGYAVDLAVARLRSFRVVPAAIVHGGASTVYALGAPPGEAGWPVRLRSPVDGAPDYGSLVLHDRALSGSARAESTFVAGGRRYGHLLDPRTGEPARGLEASWALAPTATESDALSTAFFVFTPAETRAYCDANPEVGAILLPEGAGALLRFGTAVMG
jgi:thiamine biosynthesis lipoprotein